MKFRFLILILFALECSTGKLEAQVVLPDLQPDMILDRGLYRFSEFNKGEVVFRNGKFSTVMLNYNISHDEMHFIDPKGDTLKIAYPATILYINMNGSRFYYDKGWLQIIDTAQGLVLAFRQLLNKSKPVQKNGFEMMKTSEVADTDIYFKGNGQKYMQQGNNDPLALTAKESYFFGDENSQFTRAKKNYLLNYFNKHKNALTTFIEVNHTNFNSLGDLLKLMAFCKQLE